LVLGDRASEIVNPVAGTLEDFEHTLEFERARRLSGHEGPVFSGSPGLASSPFHRRSVARHVTYGHKSPFDRVGALTVAPFPREFYAPAAGISQNQ